MCVKSLQFYTFQIDFSSLEITEDHTRIYIFVSFHLNPRVCSSCYDYPSKKQNINEHSLLQYKLKQQLQSANNKALIASCLKRRKSFANNNNKRENVCDSEEKNNRNVKIVYAKSVHLIFFLLYFYFSYKSSQRQIQGVRFTYGTC